MHVSRQPHSTPYIPAPFRGVPVNVSARTEQGSAEFGAGDNATGPGLAVADSTDANELPWIDAYLEESGAHASGVTGAGAGQLAVEEKPSAGQLGEEGHSSADAAGHQSSAASMQSHASDITADESANEDAADDEWPLSEAQDRMNALGDFPRRERMRTPGRAPGEVRSRTPMPMWGDEPWMDIMPTHDSVGGQASADVPQDNDRVHGSQSSESAAAILEALADRVRRGELPLDGFQASMGDAAALAATLAALLGVRR